MEKINSVEIKENVPDDEPYKYEQLTGHSRTNGSYKTTEQLQTQYVRLTDELVRQMTDGVDVVNPETGEHERNKPDYVVYLDKSARPVSWLVKELWPQLAADENGNVPSMPESKFVNIDREQWRHVIDPKDSGIADTSKLDASKMRSLRSIFLKNPRDRDAGLSEDIDDAPTLFDGKTVLIIDEVLSTGRTLSYARGFFEHAFPEAKLATAHWMSGIMVSNKKGSIGAVGNADLPVWYREDIEQGRGVGNRLESASQTSNSRAQHLGAWFLSTRFTTPDIRGNKLRDEIHHLGSDVRDGKVFVEPSSQRDIEDFDRIALGLNHIESLEEYKQLKQEHDQQ